MCISDNALIIFPHENRWVVHRQFRKTDNFLATCESMNVLNSKLADKQAWLINDLKLVYRGIPAGSAIKILDRAIWHWCIWAGLNPEGEPMIIRWCPQGGPATRPRIDTFSQVLEEFASKKMVVYLCDTDVPSHFCRAAALHKALVMDFSHYRVSDDGSEFVLSCFDPLQVETSKESWEISYPKALILLKIIIGAAFISSVFGFLPVEILLFVVALHVVLDSRSQQFISKLTMQGRRNEAELFREDAASNVTDLFSASNSLIERLKSTTIAREDIEAQVEEMEEKIIKIFYFFCQYRTAVPEIVTLEERAAIKEFIKSHANLYLSVRHAHFTRLILDIRQANDNTVLNFIRLFFTDMKALFMALQNDFDQQLDDTFARSIAGFVIHLTQLFNPGEKDQPWWTDQNLTYARYMIKQLSRMIASRYPIRVDIEHRRNILTCLHSYWGMIITFYCRAKSSNSKALIDAIDDLTGRVILLKMMRDDIMNSVLDLMETYLSTCRQLSLGK